MFTKEDLLMSLCLVVSEPNFRAEVEYGMTLESAGGVDNNNFHINVVTIAIFKIKLS